MSVEERIVQSIKSDAIVSLVGDEDALLELARRAIAEVMFKERPGYGYNSRPEPSIIEKAARDQARIVAQQVVEKACASEDVQSAMREYIAAAMPGALRDAMMGQFQASVDVMVNDAGLRIRESLERT
ncbi:MAG: hypothetical protein AAFW98_18860 [Pseudomonadota bacterium]